MDTNEFGLEIGQPIRRRLKVSKKTDRKFVAYADIPLPDKTFDKRVILIDNDYRLDENSAGKFCTLQIIGRYENFYVAEADELGVSKSPELTCIYGKLNSSDELTFEMGVVGEDFRIPMDWESIFCKAGGTHEQFETLYNYLKNIALNIAQQCEDGNVELMLYF